MEVYLGSTLGLLIVLQRGDANVNSRRKTDTSASKRTNLGLMGCYSQPLGFNCIVAIGGNDKWYVITVFKNWPYVIIFKDPQVFYPSLPFGLSLYSLVQWNSVCLHLQVSIPKFKTCYC